MKKKRNKQKSDTVYLLKFSYIYIYIYIYTHTHKGVPHGIVANVLDSDIVVTEFKHAIMFLFGLMPFGKGMNPSNYGLNSTTTLLLQGWL